MPDSASRSLDQPRRHEFGETTRRLVDAHEPGDRLPSVRHHNGRATGHLAQVGTEVVLELANSHLDRLLCSYIHDRSVATRARQATGLQGARLRSADVKALH